ncbi:S8 family peptidase [Streptomyces sp. NPDC088387]|uniref:S8 family peptidase n=1 Tax=Streptomyces sp. NPDC088387 TaxID=3365859 RepID=UPI0038158BB8
MRRQFKRAGAATVAAAAAVALAAGLTNPASAEAEPSATRAGQAVARHHVTLITGDRVALDAKGRVTGLEPAKGREGIPVQVRRADGHTLVIPADAAHLVANGTLDQRLFDVTELNKAANRKAQKNGLKVIVGYKGAASAAKSDVRDAGTLRQSLKSLNADAVQTPKDDAPDLWAAVTNGDRSASGIAHVWLDGVRKVALDKSVPQIGAPKAWSAGFDGKGVKIAVLDTGVDTTHPDLKTQVVESKNFTGAADASDKYGHGTHVASIAAGTGAKSGGKFKGVAPGATILNGKVLDDTGFGDDSGILAGMEWAAAQGADIINMSLGQEDTPGIDPVEGAVNRLSAEKDVLFAIAAGNAGPQGLGSPGSAEAALTVGAVDDKDELADFSSTGPRLDGAIKPDVTAPGVAITAASAKGSLLASQFGENPAGYLTIDGTSMATPHVAGAAAILKQQHPDWTYTELKAALTASTKGGKYSVFEQGSGRIQVDKAIKQTVFAEPVSVSFGTQSWPHTDDTPVTKKLTYRNTGTAAVTLNLASTATNPKGQAAPAGFFKLGATKVTVPAGGTASVDVTVNTKLGGTVDGAYSAYVVATGGGQTVRTAAGVQREIESYDLTVKHIGRDGKEARNYNSFLSGLSGLALYKEYPVWNENSGTVKLRLPKGVYVFDSSVFVDPEDLTKGADWIAQPKLNLNKNTTLTVDARKAKPVDVTVPDAAAKQQLAVASYEVAEGDAGASFTWLLDSYTNVRTAHLGPQITDGTLVQQFDNHWLKGADKQYSTIAGGKVKQLATGFTKHYKASELATVKVNAGAPAPGKTGTVIAYGWLPDVSGATSLTPEQKLPGTRTLYLSAVNGAKWDLSFDQNGGRDPEGGPIAEVGYGISSKEAFKGGQTYTKTVNRAVFGPTLNSSYGLFREGNDIVGSIPLFTDSKKNVGSSAYDSATTTLYRNGTKVGSNSDPLFGGDPFKVPAGDAEYRLTTSVKRSAKVAEASTRIDAGWTFRSKKTSGLTHLPASTVRFQAATGADSKVTANATATFPVVVEGAAKGSNLKSLEVYVSYDAGQTWKKTEVRSGKITVKNPAKGKSISLKANITDKKNNKSTLSIYNAYYGK